MADLPAPFLAAVREIADADTVDGLQAAINRMMALNPAQLATPQIEELLRRFQEIIDAKQARLAEIEREMAQ